MSRYNLKNIPLAELGMLLYSSLDLGFKTWTDKLDCRESFARQRQTDKTVGEIIDLGVKQEGSFIDLMLRNGQCEYDGWEDYWEVGVRVQDKEDRQKEYFLWVNLSLKEGEKLIQDFNLKP